MKTNASPTFPAFPGDAAVVTPNDDNNFEPSVIYTGTGGTIRVLTAEGTDITVTNLAAGSILPVRVVRVFSTTTTATDIIRIF